MSTTTTIYPEADARMYEGAPTTNYGSNDKLKIGWASGTAKFDSAVLEFDVSAYTAPTDIVQALFSLKVIAEWGTGGAAPITVSRCTKPFAESQATWNIYSTGNDWDSAGGDGALTEPTYTIYVGNSSGDQTIDIKELLVDAINRRSGVLRILCRMNSTPAWTAIANYGSVENATVGNRPTLQVKVASRIRWVGDISGDADNASNWTARPSESDYVFFNTGSNSVTSGTITCHSLFVSKQFTGDIMQSDGSAITIVGDTAYTGQRAIINKKEGKYNLEESGSIQRTVHINETPIDSCTFKNANSSWNAIVYKSDGNVNVIGNSNLMMTSKKVTKKVTTSGTVTDIICCRGQLTLDNGCGSLYAVESTCIVTAGVMGAPSYIIGGAVVYMNSAEMGNVDIVNGKLTFKNNANSSITTEDITLWRNGVFDSRTNTGSWNDTASPSISIRGGGNFLVDLGRSLAIAN